MRFHPLGAVLRPVGWVAAFLGGSLLGLALRVACFVIGVVLLKLVGNVIVGLEPLLPFLDPVYPHTPPSTA